MASSGAVLRGGRGAVPTRGGLTRSRIIEQTARLCRERRGGGISVAEIAEAAGVFPNLITHHFGSKDSLLVHGAFFALLHDAERLESIGDRAISVQAFRRALARTALALPSLPAVARALSLGIARDDLGPVVDGHLKLLFRQSESFVRRVLQQRGWRLSRPVSVEVRTFWSTALGAVLLYQAGAAGTVSDLDLPGVLSVQA